MKEIGVMIILIILFVCFVLALKDFKKLMCVYICMKLVKLSKLAMENRGRY